MMRLFDEERVLVTNNAGDFLKITADTGVHPGLIVLPLSTREGQKAHLSVAIASVEEAAGAVNAALSDYMVNRVVEIDETGEASHYEYPSPPER